VPGLGEPFESEKTCAVIAHFRTAALALPLAQARQSLFAMTPRGPVFLGFLAPHIARFAGARQPLQQLWVASAFGAVLMVVSEWLGRQLVFPEQMPAGLVATLLGGPYLVLLMLYRRKS